MQSLFEIIGQYGFPIAVSAFCLLKLDKSLVDLNRSLERLIVGIEYTQKKVRKSKIE